MKTKKWIQFSSAILCLLIVFSVLPVQALAAESVDISKDCSLTVEFTPEDVAAKDVDFWLYRVGNISSDGEFSLEDTYADISISLKEPNADTWRTLTAALLSQLAADDSISPTANAQTNAKGFAGFSPLPTGLYLVIGEAYYEDGWCYVPTPFLVCLPSAGTDGEWDYAVEVETKYSFYSETQTLDLEVLKVWKDNNSSNRPTEIVVELYNEDGLYDTVKLNKDNNWRHQWNDLPATSLWSVKEKEVPAGYSVAIEQQGNRFVITNSKASSTTPSPDPEVPQTGVLWWPVPVLIAGGLLLILLGILKRRCMLND